MSVYSASSFYEEVVQTEHPHNEQGVGTHNLLRPRNDKNTSKKKKKKLKCLKRHLEYKKG